MKRAPVSNRKKLPAFRFVFLIPLYVCIAALFTFLIKRGNVQLLNPQGYIADQQSKLLWGVIIFAAIVGITMITAFFVVIFRYHEDNQRKYDPSGAISHGVELAAWWVQLLAIIVISVLVWNTAHQLDPYKPLAQFKKTINVEVIALQWKWLFIYPDQHVATINQLEIPTGEQVAFKLTADAPMNSFWIPQLSGQIYAMPGMINQLHIEADHPGVYAGSPAEISGDDFASMTFNVTAVRPADFDKWVADAQRSSKSLDYITYNQLTKPSGYVAPATYKLPYNNLFDVVVMKYMVPGLAPATAIKEGDKL